MKYNDKTKLQLIELCKSKNIKNYSKLNKEQLIQLLQKSKTGGTKKNMNNYIEKKHNSLRENTNNDANMVRYKAFSGLFYEIKTNTYFDLLSYFKENENKDFLDFIIDKRNDDLHNFIYYKFEEKGRHLDHWEYVISIIKKEKTISLFDFYIIWTGAYGCNIYNEDKINYYKTIIQEIKNFKNHNKSKNFDNFMVYLKQKLKKNNNLKEIFKPYLTENLPSRLEEIKNKNLISDGYKKSIDKYIEKQKNNKFEYIELEENHFIYNQLKDIWEGIDNKSFIELVTGIAYKKNINNQKIKTLYKVGNNIYLSRNKFMNKIQSDKQLKFVYDESIEIMNKYNFSPNNMLDILTEIYVKENNIKSKKLFSDLYNLKYKTIKKFQNKKYKNLLTAYYMKIFGSNNFGRFMSTKNIKTNDLPNFYKIAEINYYCKNNEYNSTFLYKMHLIDSYQLIPDIRVKYYKKLHTDMLKYKNNTNNTNNFSSFMTDFKNKIKYNNFQIDEEYQLYITKFKYCKNEINNNTKIDIMYKDLQKSTSIYKTWEKLYNKLSKNKNLTLKDFILDGTKDYLYCNNGLKYINKDNNDFNELYTYKIYNNNSNRKTPKRIEITKTQTNETNNEYDIVAKETLSHFWSFLKIYRKQCSRVSHG